MRTRVLGFVALPFLVGAALTVGVLFYKDHDCKQQRISYREMISPNCTYRVAIERPLKLEDDSNPKLVVKDTAGVVLTTIDSFPVLIEDYIWSRDSKYLAFVAGTGIGVPEGDGYVVNVYVISIENGAITPVTYESDPSCTSNIPIWESLTSISYLSVCHGDIGTHIVELSFNQ